MRTLLICMLCAATAYAQYNNSPAPRRYQVPSAIALDPRPVLRQGRIQAIPIPAGAIRNRRPLRPSFKSVDAAPRPGLQNLEEPVPTKPVTEEPEDVEINTPTPFSPNLIYSTQEPQNDFFDITTTSQPKPPIAFNPQPFQQSTPSPYKPEPVKPTQYRPLLQQQPFQPNRNEVPNKAPQPIRLQPLSIRPNRPSFRPEPKPFVDEEEIAAPAPVRQYNQRPQEPIRAPVKQAPQKYTPTNPREKKPVAQIIRKYREENEDGTIVWGFENDDGSFKEETIGIDCVTRGKYGYVDPDGLKREYNYETGILCDKNRNKDDPEQKGFIDYQENKAVLPNGITIDLAAMGKKSKRPFRSPTNH